MTRYVSADELEDFIASSLTQIANGVRKAQEEASDSGAWINPAGVIYRTGESTAIQIDTDAHSYLQEIRFDVAVTVTEGRKRGAKGGIKVFGSGMVSGGESGSERSAVSRLQFSIPMALPPSRNEELEKKRAASRQKTERPGPLANRPRKR